MPKISTRSGNMPSSPIRKLVPFADKAKKEGTKVYHLNIGQPDIETPQVVFDKMNAMDLKVIEYSHSAGFESYREGLSKYYSEYNVNVNKEQILVTTGGSEALYMAMMSCFNPGDEVIIPEPFYANYNGMAIAAGVTVVPVTATIDNNYALPPISEIEKKVTDKTKAIIICNPGNPTGYLYSEEEIKELKKIIVDHDLYLIADEVYREFCYDAKPFSVMNLEGVDNNVVIIDSVSKRYSMCGARIGAFVTKNKELYDVALKFAQARLSPPTFGQIASEAALETPKSYFDEVSAEYVKRRDILVEGLNSIEGVTCPKPNGAFYAMAQLPIDDSDKFCQWILESYSYEGQTVMMAPATGFYSTPGLGKQEVRLAYVLNEADLRKAVEVLRNALGEYQKQMITQADSALA